MLFLIKKEIYMLFLRFLLHKLTMMTNLKRHFKEQNNEIKRCCFYSLFYIVSVCIHIFS